MLRCGCEPPRVSDGLRAAFSLDPYRSEATVTRAGVASCQRAHASLPILYFPRFRGPLCGASGFFCFPIPFRNFDFEPLLGWCQQTYEAAPEPPPHSQQESMAGQNQNAYAQRFALRR